MMTANTDEGREPVSLPEVYSRRELNALYREIPLKDNTSRLLRKYFNAMANLYGVISLRDALMVIRRFSPRTVTDEEFLAFAEIARHECEGYWVLGRSELYIDVAAGDVLDREIICTALLEAEEDLYAKTVHQQMEKPLYIPPDKASLLAYAEPFYVEKTAEYAALADFIEAHMPVDWLGYERTVVLDEIFDLLRVDVDLNALISLLDEMEIRFTSENDIEQFAERWMSYMNNARLFVNRGHTPNELSAMNPHRYEQPQTASIGPHMRAALARGDMTVEDLRQEFLTVDLPHENVRKAFLEELDAVAAEIAAQKKCAKVGRNDPCPCGSEKKYKKCCGK